MRSLLMFDLPVVTAKQRRNYRKFVALLKTEGFIMFQESIYMKLSINQSNVDAVLKVIKNNLPPEGLISVITITEKQFQDMDFLLGEFKTNVVNTDERVIEL